MIILATCELYGGRLFPPSHPTPVPRCSPLTASNRLHDLLPRMARRQRQPRHQQLHVSLGLLVLLQHSLGLDPALDHMVLGPGYFECVRCKTGEEEPVEAVPVGA